MFNGKTLLITGGTGSFGNAVLDRFLNTAVKEIRIFSRTRKNSTICEKPTATTKSSSISAMYATGKAYRTQWLAWTMYSTRRH